MTSLRQQHSYKQRASSPRRALEMLLLLSAPFVRHHSVGLAHSAFVASSNLRGITPRLRMNARMGGVGKGVRSFGAPTISNVIRAHGSNSQQIQIEPEVIQAVLNVASVAAYEAGDLIKHGIGSEVRATKASPRDLLTEVDGAAQREIEKRVKEAFPDHAFLGEENVEPGADAAAKAADKIIKSNDWVWIVDPIDGTTNFASGLPLSAVSIGVAFKGQLVVGVIYDPFQNELFHAVKGQGAFCNGKEAIRTNPATELVDAVVFAGSPPALNSMSPSLRGITALMPRVRTVRLVGSAALMLAWVAAGRASAYFEADLNAWDTAAGALLIQEAGGRVADALTNEPYDLFTRRILATNGPLHDEIQEILLDAGAAELDP